MGSRIRLSVDWPVALDGKLPLQFIVTGHVVRIAENHFGVLFHHHEFCIMKKLPESVLTL